MYNQQSRGGVFCNPGLLRLVMLLISICLVGYLITHPLNLSSGTANLPRRLSCPPCVCDCSSEALFSLPSGLLNNSLLDCGKNDPEMSSEIKKDLIDLLSEELRLLKGVMDDNVQHTRGLISDARKTSSQYQKEAEKCNVGIETCEEAREKAEAELIAERKLSALWESRARETGWKDLRRRYFYF
ncbi:hypothetical protein MKW94_026960 [Papaver nudicaule]|uniref:Uncharacterized protein n=1 Tax=Papaver nudicaule TaxID=74823 RepID=A0AA41RR48_PAPNU|nr:hypothetical protein [Papaver nudicaule]MCL7030558.1 hypothetical protein [Papaver nudicaule]